MLGPQTAPTYVVPLHLRGLLHRTLKVIFTDWDGVYTDTLRNSLAHATRAQKMMGGAGRPPRIKDFMEADPLTFRRIGELIGLSGQDLIRFERNVFQNERSTIETRRFFPGADHTLASLACIAPIVVVTSSSAESVLNSARRVGVSHAVSEILDGSTNRTKAERISDFLKRNRLLPSQAVMIGDAGSDVAAANLVGVPCIAATWGFQSRDLLEAKKPSSFADSPLALPGAVLSVVTACKQTIVPEPSTKSGVVGIFDAYLRLHEFMQAERYPKPPLIPTATLGSDLAARRLEALIGKINSRINKILRTARSSTVARGKLRTLFRSLGELQPVHICAALEAMALDPVGWGSSSSKRRSEHLRFCKAHLDQVIKCGRSRRRKLMGQHFRSDTVRKSYQASKLRKKEEPRWSELKT